MDGWGAFCQNEAQVVEDMRDVLAADPLRRKMFYAAWRMGCLEAFRAGDEGAVRAVAASVAFYWSLFQLPEYSAPQSDLASLFNA